MSSKQTNFGVLAGAVIIGVVLGCIGYYLLIRPIIHSSGAQSVPPVTAPIAASSTAVSSSTAAAVDTSDWQTYTNYELGFSVQYPANMDVDTSNPSIFKVTFPTNVYFSTVYADSVSFSISENQACPTIPESDTVMPTQNVTIGGVAFVRDESSGIGAGNIDDVTSYDANNNGVCYQILVADRHANGAGLYVSDAPTIAADNAARDADYAHVTAVVNAMIASFDFVSTPTGEDEGAYYASGSGTPSPVTPIFISTVSPSVISVGGILKVIGQGFTGHDTIVQISNGSVKAVLWGGMPTSDTSLSLSVPSKVCTIYTGASGAVCPSYLILTPGVYTVDVTNQNGTTDNSFLKIQ